MWQSQIILTSRSSGYSLVVSIPVMLLAVVTSGLSTAAAEDVKVNRQIQVTCDCLDNQPGGTLITQLGDHNLTLKNFRSDPNQGPLPFRIDAASGAVCTVSDDQLKSESQREFQIRVLADEDPEYDEFMAEFSAGLIDSGLREDDLKSLSVATVVFEINVRLSNAPAAPVLEDAHFTVELKGNKSVEIGCVNSSDLTPSEDRRFYLVSGNEDGIFEINQSSGVLTMDGSAVGTSDPQMDFELQILAENSAGEFATSNVFVKVQREIQEVVSEAPALTSTPAVTASPEITAGNELSNTPVEPKPVENEELTAEPRAPETQPDSVVHEETEVVASINSLPNINAIDVAEVEQWVGHGDAHTVRENVTSVSPGAKTNVGFELPNTESGLNASAQISFQDSPGYLLTIGAFSVFLMACIAVILIWTHASANRVQKLEDEASEERLKAALNGIQQDEEIRQLKSELAERDQTIARLKKELRSITHDFASDDAENGDFLAPLEQDSRTDDRIPSSADSRTMNGESCDSSRPDHGSVADARASLGSAFEMIGRELARETQSFSVPSHGASDAFESSGPAIATLDDPQELRNELADLFALHSLEEPDSSNESLEPALGAEFAAVAAETFDAELLQKQQYEAHQHFETSAEDDQVSEDLHLDSVKLYLEKLLERSQDATNPEAILADRRKTTDSHRGVDRRVTPEPSPRPPVKSYLDAYMSAHGGKLADDANTTGRVSSMAAPERLSEPPKPRLPVDVNSIRETMNSLRVVSIQSSEHALLSHLLREAKAKIAWRTVMVAGMAGITVLTFLANMKHVIDFSYLNWFMSSLVVLAICELCLRIHAVMKQRRNVTSVTLSTAQPCTAKRVLPSVEAVKE